LGHPASEFHLWHEHNQATQGAAQEGPD